VRIAPSRKARSLLRQDVERGERERYTVVATDQGGSEMHARLTRIQGSPEQIEGALEMAKRDVLPTLQGCDGYQGFSVGVDRSSGAMFGLSYFDSAENLRASDDAVREKREATAQQAGGSPEVAEYEIVIDDEA
jgi:hypothetical protein